MFPNYKLKLLVVLAFFPIVTLGQPTVKTGSIGFLTNSRSFGPLKLGSDIDALPYQKLSFLEDNNKPDSDSCFTYQFMDSTMTDLEGIVPLYGVCIRTYKNKIVNIYIFFSKNYGYALLRNFLTLYGLFTSKPDDYLDFYKWTSKSVDLTLRYEPKKSLGMAIYTWNEINDNLTHKSLEQVNVNLPKH
jgi:hypothetical protein